MALKALGFTIFLVYGIMFVLSIEHTSIFFLSEFTSRILNLTDRPGNRQVSYSLEVSKQRSMGDSTTLSPSSRLILIFFFRSGYIQQNGCSP